MKRRITTLIMFVLALAGTAQMVNPVHWSKAVKMTDDRHGVVSLTAAIEPGWHLYSTRLPAGGPIPTTVEWKKLDGVKLDGTLKPSSKPHEQHDDAALFQLVRRIEPRRPRAENQRVAVKRAHGFLLAVAHIEITVIVLGIVNAILSGTTVVFCQFQTWFLRFLKIFPAGGGAAKLLPCCISAPSNTQY